MNSGKRPNLWFYFVTFFGVGLLFLVAKENSNLSVVCIDQLPPEGIEAKRVRIVQKDKSEEEPVKKEEKIKPVLPKDDEENDVKPREGKIVEKDKKKFEISVDRGFWKGSDSVKHHVFDEPLAASLFKFFDQENANYVIDLGAGMGKYTQYFSTRGLTVNCYDGNPDTQEISEGRCAVIDLTKSVHFNPYDWVLSLEVGEHLPKEFEDVYLKNLDRVNLKGAIISWAVEGQGGDGHVNNRNNDYIIDKVQKMGYKYDKKAAGVFREAATMYWFKNTIMVFRKN